MNLNLASLHGYLCADGCVVKSSNPKYKYYRIELRNINSKLLNDFKNKFQKVFNIKAHIYRNERCRLGSKEIYNKLNKQFGSFYSHNWTLPILNKIELIYWIRSYFDCEAWVRNKPRQDRHIGLDCINKKGLLQIQKALLQFNIVSKVKKRNTRNIYTLNIYGKENIIKFQKEINFLHPNKRKKLQQAIDSYIDYNWEISKESIKQKARVKKPFFIRIISNLELNLIKIQKFLKKYYIESIIYKNKNGQGTIYYSLIIQKKKSIIKTIKNQLISKEQIKRIDSKLYK